MRRRAGSADAGVESRRAGAAEAWHEITEAVRSETGLAMRAPAWSAAIGGLAIGLELARRWTAGSRRDDRSD